MNDLTLQEQVRKTAEENPHLTWSEVGKRHNVADRLQNGVDVVEYVKWCCRHQHKL